MTMMPEDFGRMEKADLLNLVAVTKERDRLRAELRRYRCALVLDADKHLSPETVSAELALAIIDRDEAIKAAENEKINHGVTVEMLLQAQKERDAARAVLRDCEFPIRLSNYMPMCASCRQIQVVGHEYDCAWKRAMGET